MSIVYDNWERLVGATLKREQLRQLACADSTQSDINFNSPLHDDPEVLEIVKSIISSNQWKVDDLVKIEGAPEALVQLIKEPIGLTTTKASLSAIYQMVALSATFPNNKAAGAYFAEIGLVPALIEILVDSQPRTFETALGILDCISSCHEGMEKACENSLMVPVVVKKILSVSDLATQFSVSILWKLGKNEEGGWEGGAVLEAVEVGAIAKLLYVPRACCSEITRKKASELLKLFRKSPACLEVLCIP